MITKTQIIAVQVARRSVNLDDADYRLVLRNLGRVGGERPSTKDLTQKGFEQVMIYFARVGAKVPNGADYWLRKQDTGHFASERETHLINELIAKTPYTLDALCRKFSQDRAIHPSKLRPQEAHKLIEMLKSAAARIGQDQEGQRPG